MLLNIKERHILDVAEAVFSDHGFKETSTRTIAKKADVNIAMLHYYFKTKENLFHRVLDRKIEGFNLKLNQSGSKKDSHLDRLTDIVELSIDLISSNWQFYRFIVREHLLKSNAGATQSIISFFNYRLNSIKKILSDGVTDGYFIKMDVEYTCQAILGMLSGMLFDINVDPSTIQDTDRIKVFFRGYFYTFLNKLK